MEFYLSQIIGIFVFLSAIASMQFKNIVAVLVSQLICNGLGALNFILLGSYSGCGICIVALVQSIVYFLIRYRNKKAPTGVAVFFIFMFLLCSVVTYKTPTDLISGAAAMTCAFSLIQKNSTYYRVFMLANGLIWMVYDVNIGAYSMILSHAATFISAGIGMLRLDLKKTKNLKG